METINFYLGERRTIEVEVTSCDEAPFVIRNPVYRLKQGDRVETDGVPAVDEHFLKAIVQPSQIGRYELEFEFEIANEILIRRLPIYVRR